MQQYLHLIKHQVESTKMSEYSVNGFDVSKQDYDKAMNAPLLAAAGELGQALAAWQGQRMELKDRKSKCIQGANGHYITAFRVAPNSTAHDIESPFPIWTMFNASDPSENNGISGTRIYVLIAVLSCGISLFCEACCALVHFGSNVHEAVTSDGNFVEMTGARPNINLPTTSAVQEFLQSWDPAADKTVSQGLRILNGSWKETTWGVHELADVELWVYGPMRRGAASRRIWRYLEGVQHSEDIRSAMLLEARRIREECFGIQHEGCWLFAVTAARHDPSGTLTG